MYKKYKSLIIVILVVAALLYFNPGSEITIPVEKIDIPSGIGIDLIKDNNGQVKNLLSMSSYTFNEKEKIDSIIVSGSGLTIPATRETRQLQSNHLMFVALQKAIIFSEDMCRSGINDSLDVLFANEYMNNMGWAVVCKGRAVDILKFKVDHYPSSTDFIDGMIENSKEYNFFSDNYKIMDMYVRVGAEGRSLVLPYIEIVNDKIQITGIALFVNDKMVRKIDINDTHVMNMLREDSAKGILELRDSFKKYASLQGKTKRKISCEKSGDKFSFTINLDYSGDLICNTLIEDLDKDPKAISTLEKAIEQKTEEQCQDFINKMQNEYKIDCLELARVACAKYGRRTGVNWDEVISNSDIKVNIKIKITNSGRGSYTATSEN